MCKSKLSSPSGGRIHTTTFSLFHSFTSVHFLSCSFNARKWYRNPDAALTMCCVNFHLQQAVSASLTREQKYIVDRMVEAHRLYRAQDSSHGRVGHSVETLGINIYIYLWETSCTSKNTATFFMLASWRLVCVCSVVWVAMCRRRGGPVRCPVTPPAKAAPVCQDSAR